MIPLKDENPSRTTPFMTVAIIAMNIAVYVYQIVLGPVEEEFVTRYGAIPAEVLHWGSYAHDFPVPYTLFSAMFIHGNFLHIGGNMLFLWVFGDNVEDFLGHTKFFLFYLFTGAVASLTHILAAPDSAVPMIGASGAISGVLGAYFLLFPTARILTLIPFFPFFFRAHLPAAMFLGLWFLMQILNAPTGGGVAWFAHIGGFVAGFILAAFSSRRKRRRRRTSEE